MLSEFRLYLELGLRHIADLAGYDHILFIAALAIPYALRDWRPLAVLVTAFTVGHSLTLALATLRVVQVSGPTVEVLIPVTILVTALLAFAELRDGDGHHRPATTPLWRYVIAAGFGMIHGLGFSSYLRALLGAEEGIVLPLLAFNVGLELGQLLILLSVLVIGASVGYIGVTRRRWMQFLCVTTGGMALFLLSQRLRSVS